MAVGLYRLHDCLPLLVLQLKVECFLRSILDGALRRGHLVPPQTRYDPAQTLVRHNLNLEADEFYFLSVGEISVRLVNYAIINSSVNRLQS